MNNRVLPHISALFTMVVWGVTFVSTKVLLDYLGPLEILVARTVLGFAVLCLIRPHILRLKERRHELLFMATGLTGTCLYYIAENTALQFADASFVSIVVSTAPLFTALLSFAILKERSLGVRFFVGFVIAISGIALISLQSGPAHASLQGALLCLGAAVSWAVYSNVIKRLSDYGYETIAVTKRTFAWGLLFLVVIGLITGMDFSLEVLTQPIVFGNLAFLGILASAICFVTWGYSVEHLGPTSASAYIYLQSPLTVVWAVLLIDEPFTAAIVIGIVLVITGLALSEGFDKQVKAAAKERLSRTSD